MHIQNYEIAKKFNQIADLLEIEGANHFRIRAYRNAARTLLSLSENVYDLVHDRADLTSLSGIGKDLASKIIEIVDTGHLALLDQIEKQTPAILAELLKLPQLGPKRVQLLYKSFNIKSLRELKKIVKNKKILELKGIGEKIRLGLIENLNKKSNQRKMRISLYEAEKVADSVLKYLKKAPGIITLSVAGSLRRKKETIGDIDVVASSTDKAATINFFLLFSAIIKVLSHGVSRSTVILNSGVQVDLRVVDEICFGSALLYLTGSKEHNIALRTMALKNGLKINEYGIFKNEKRLASLNEEDIYNVLNLRYIEPELRENSGELEASLNGTLPKLVSFKDIKGDLHTHSKATDGANTIKEMAKAAKALGYSYIAITEHSKRLSVAHGLDKKKLLKQVDEIDRLNDQLKDFTILKSIEVDILENGELDLPDEVLEKLDITICAIHSYFKLSKDKQTSRIIRAMENKHFRILAHPTGRIIGGREAYDFDLEKILTTAKKLNRILEINAQPARMDLSDIYIRMAKENGVKLSISTDAHSVSQLNFMNLGVAQARRGWLDKDDIINTLSPRDLRKLLKNL